MKETEILEEQKKYSLLRTLRKEQYRWRGWRHNRSTLVLLPYLLKENNNLSAYPPAQNKFVETTHWYLPDLKAIQQLVENFAQLPRAWPPFDELAFAFFPNTDVMIPTDRPDYKYELYALIKELAPIRCKLWTLNPITKDVEFTDTAPLYVSLGLY